MPGGFTSASQAVAAGRPGREIETWVIDDKWKDHLYDLDHLKASISFPASPRSSGGCSLAG